MGDHWKSLANKLGAPGVDAPTPAPSAPTQPSSAAASPNPSRPTTSRSEPRKPVDQRPVDQRPVAEVPNAERTNSERERPERERLERVTPERLSSETPVPQQSSHDRHGHSRSVEAKAPAASTGSEPAHAAESSRGSATRREPAPTREGSSRSATAGRAQAESAETRASDKPAKRKSSWDTLTSFFGISSTPVEQSSPASEPVGSAPAETDSLNLSAGRDSKAASQSPPSALDVLFGDAPRQELSWDKPKPKRMVDDVSGWDEPAAQSHVEEEPLPHASSEPAARLPGVEDEDAAAPQRRRRRRRRGGRRDRDDEGSGERSDRPEARGRRSTTGDADLDPRSSAADHAEDGWSGAAGRSAASPSGRRDELQESAGRHADDQESGEPERRSNRRRRRGRSRDVDAAGLEVREPRETFDDGDLAEPGPKADAERGAGHESSGRERSERREPRRESSRREPRRRNEERTRGRGSNGETARREPAPIDDEEDQVDVSLAAELEEGGPNRHPKIPTWADTLEAIIAANTENHRRLESQRGGPPRGRPRSGGGGNNPSSGQSGSGSSSGSGGQGGGGRR